MSGCFRKVASEIKVASSIRSLVSTKSLKSECIKAMRESLIVPVLMFANESGMKR